MTEQQRVLVVSDLHMAAGPLDPFHRDELFIRFLEGQVGSGAPPRLIILGDLFDFVLTPPTGRGPVSRPDTSEAGALARLERIAAEHHRVIEGLAAFAAAGGTLELVAGNHDIELVRPAVQLRFRALLGHPAGDRLRIRPWIIHVPGVLYAEHGHQHHDLNAFATLLEPYRNGDELDPPIGRQLAHLEAHGSGGAWLCALAVAASAARTAASRRDRTRLLRYRTHRVVEEAARLGLDASTLAALDAVTPRTPGATALRLAKQVITGDRHPASMLHLAAERIHRLLAARSRAVPHYIFGHSHVAERRALLQGPEAPLYLNAGTWSELRRGDGAQGCSYVEVVASDAPVAELRTWGDDASLQRPAALTAAG